MMCICFLEYPSKETVSVNGSSDNIRTQLLIRVIRPTEKNEYGFDLSTHENTHCIQDVRDGTPAYKAGLRKDDLILEINGEWALGIEHSEAVEKILQFPTHVNLLVRNKLNGK